MIGTPEAPLSGVSLFVRQQREHLHFGRVKQGLLERTPAKTCLRNSENRAAEKNHFLGGSSLSRVGMSQYSFMLNRFVLFCRQRFPCGRAAFYIRSCSGRYPACVTRSRRSRAARGWGSESNMAQGQIPEKKERPPEHVLRRPLSFRRNALLSGFRTSSPRWSRRRNLRGPSR